MRSPEGLATTLACFGLSLLVNGAVFVSVSRHFSAAPGEKEALALRQKAEALRFEFVESPVKKYRLPPRHTQKISNRDALDQDQSHKLDAHGAPAVKTLGPADQLSQTRKISSPPSAAVAEQPAKPKAEKNEPSPNSPQTGETGIPAAVVHSQAAVSKPQEARREQKAASGAVTPQGKIESQEMAKTRSGGAALFGVTSFEATGSGMGEYMKNLKEKVWGAWFPYVAFKYPQEFVGSDATLIITLNSKGEVKMVRVEESKGSEAFTTICLEAVQRASGFGNIPSEVLDLVGKDQINLRFAFHYR